MLHCDAAGISSSETVTILVHPKMNFERDV